MTPPHVAVLALGLRFEASERAGVSPAGRFIDREGLGKVPGDADRYTHLATALIRNWTDDGAGSVFAVLWQLSYHHERFRRLSAEIYETFYAEIEAMIRAADTSAAHGDLAARARLMTAVLDGVAMQIHAALSEDEAARRDLLAGSTELLRSIASGPGPVTGSALA